nr:histone deacetylase 14 [Tanacetum cinerariifolium]
LDEDWFRLDANILREALEITPVDQAYQFVPPPSGDAIMDFVNQLGYLGEIHFVLRMALIIYYLGRHHNVNQSSRSPLNLVEDDLSIGNLKFVPKGEIDEVFGMQIPEELITDNIRNAPYYNV